MKKGILFFVVSLFSLGVIAQTTPAATKPAVDPQSQTVKPAVSAMPKSAENKTAKTGNAASKNNLKKTGANKKPTHHVTPVKKANTPAESKGSANENLKK